MLTADQLLVKQINKTLVLNTVYQKRPVSRAEIAKITGLNKSTVSALVDELLTEGLIIETGIGESQGGRKPVQLSINAGVGSIIGLDLGVNYILSILTDFAGKILWEKRITVKPDERFSEERIDIICELLQETINYAPSSPRGIIGIGIGVPGIVNFDRGTILSAPNLNWKNVNLKNIIEEKFHLPVILDNEANAGAIGEKWFGCCKKATDLIYVSAGRGIGAGIILNDELYRGARGIAGEIGHMTVECQGITCSCGNSGCWEEYASEKALYRYLRMQAKNYPHSLLLKNGVEQIADYNIFEIIDAAIEGDELAVQAFKMIGSYLGIGVANLINIFNPEVVVLGNTLPLVGDILMDELKREVAERSFSANYSAVRILSSELYMDACALGAAALVISRQYASPV
ncbi:MAG: ROK family protein [Pelosinus sp.]|nr:ROK family protein [Pelosinus sp.]